MAGICGSRSRDFRIIKTRHREATTGQFTAWRKTWSLLDGGNSLRTSSCWSVYYGRHDLLMSTLWGIMLVCDLFWCDLLWCFISSCAGKSNEAIYRLVAAKNAVSLTPGCFNSDFETWITVSLLQVHWFTVCRLQGCCQGPTMLHA